MGQSDNKTCLRVFLYIANSLLIAKGVLWILGIIFAVFVVFAVLGAFGRKRRATTADPLPSGLIPISAIIFGIASLVFGIIGIVATAKKHSPTLITNAVLLMMLFLAEVAIYIVVGVYEAVPVDNALLWIGVVGAVLTLVTCSLTLAWNAYVKKTRYV